jgi:hypothetical protein
MWLRPGRLPKDVGFLDRKSRVLDVILTERGRRLFANGELDFAYVSFFDDGIDYDPYGSSGSMTDEERDTYAYSTPMLECHVIPDRRSAGLPLEPLSQLFAAAQGYNGVPRLLAPPTGSQVDLRCNQSPKDQGYNRYDTTFAEVRLEISDGALQSEGFSIHVYGSGSDGLTELKTRRDLRGRRALDPFIAINVDDERPVDKPTVATERRKKRSP